MSCNTLISIITVSFQAEETIEETIKSVLEQTYENIEYIFKDGGSKDSTNLIIKQYEKLLNNKGITTRHIVSRDTGIYNAMNQALDYCNGEYVIFLNADDKLYSKNTLKEIFDSDIDIGNADIVYGDTDFVDESLHFLWKGNIEVVKDKCPFCHQSAFVKREWMKQNPYDESLQITADYDFMYKSYVQGARFFYINKIISVFKRGGTSGTKLVKDRKEHRAVQLRYNQQEEESSQGI